MREEWALWLTLVGLVFLLWLFTKDGCWGWVPPC